MSSRASRFQRYLLPGLAFKAVVIGGGYATGRELAEFFLPAGAWGGVQAMALAAVLWSLVCVVTFLFARAMNAGDYRSFFRELLGPAWPVFEIAYLIFVVLILAVFGAAAGALGAGLFGWPSWAGTVLLMALIGGFTAFGSHVVEALFKWASVLLYLVYAAFFILAVSSFGERITAAFAPAAPGEGWLLGGVTYASYNIIGAIVILPVIRHFTRPRDAVIAGAIAGPLAMLPAVLFFICMAAFQPKIADAVLPSDFLLRRLELPVFHLMFQLMIFSALLESGVGAIHAVNERLDAARQSRGRPALTWRGRLIAGGVILLFSMGLADRFGLVALIAQGYRFLAVLFLVVYVVPLLTWGVWRLVRAGRPPDAAAGAPPPEKPHAP